MKHSIRLDNKVRIEGIYSSVLIWKLIARTETEEDKGAHRVSIYCEYNGDLIRYGSYILREGK